MAGGTKKKKKPAANPARGFATTSIVSKAKQETIDNDTTAEPSESNKPAEVHSPAESVQTRPTNGTTEKPRELHELTPDELEAQLEFSELQRLVEQYAAKARKDALRQVTKLQTDKRLLRAQAQPLFLKEWLPEELMLQIQDFLTSEREDESLNPSKRSLPGDDELLSKVWQLHLCLVDLGIPSSRAKEALAFIVSHPPSDDTTVQLWGVADALDWLSLNHEIGELDDYDHQAPKRTLRIENGKDTALSASLHTNTSLEEDDHAVDQDSRMTSDDGDVGISDIESDLEPDELISVYVRTKTLLFESDPEIQDSSKSNKNINLAKTQKEASQKVHVMSAGQRKLAQRLQKIESDVLFDQREGQAQWSAKRMELVRTRAERRKLQLREDHVSNDNQDKPEGDFNAPEVQGSLISDEAERLGQELLKECDEMSDDDILGGMFSALPGVQTSAKPDTLSHGDASSVTIRDFGKLSGLNPKRILEESCKARDARCKLTYKLVSPTTFASRHSVTVQWSKEQEPFDSRFLQYVACRWNPMEVLVEMTTIAAPDTAQSEACAATAALFLIFSGSTKEAKAHMKLPPAYRDLWDEFAKQKQEASEKTDRGTVKDLRSLIEENKVPPEDEEDEIQFNPALRRLNGFSSGTSTPGPRAESPRKVDDRLSQGLREFWAQKTASPSYQYMLQVRMKLPMFQFRAEALETIERHPITILCGETGCGKSTQLPAFIVEHELSHGRKCRVYCTEPRRISAISLAQRVSEEMGEHKGDVGTARSLVGYAIRLESQTTAHTPLVYATVGIVLRMLESPDGLKDITHLVLDEVHERSIDTDFLLIVLRSVMFKRPDLKVVLMSATVDAQRFSSYLDGAPIITVPGRTFPVGAKFLEDAIELTGHTNEDATKSNENDDDDDDIEKTDGTGNATHELSGYSKKTRATIASYDEYHIDYSLIDKLLVQVAYSPNYREFSKAILIFLPGIAEIRQLNDLLTGHPSFSRDWRIYPLHSTFSSEDQQAAFEIPPDGVRKIVLATNIAETGITIPDVTCVIDTGKHKEMRFDERRQMSRLIQSFISRANAKQRRGRAGRVQEGICFHLFTKHRHDNLMVDQQTPEMLRLSLQDLVMRVKICKLGDIEHALSQALDPPSARNIRRAIDALYDVGALTAKEELTSLGQQLAKLPVDAQLGKLILFGSLYRCLDFALTIAATLSSKSPFLSPMHAKKQADTVRLGFKRGDSDLLTVYNAYCAWRKVCTTSGISEFNFCNKNFLSHQNLSNIEDLKGQLLMSLVDAGFVKLNPEERTALSRMRYNQRHRHFVALPEAASRIEDNDEVANSVVAWSFYPKILVRDGKGWRNIANNQSLGLHPTSVNKAVLNPDVAYLSFYSIMQSSSRFTNAQETSPVSDFALVLLAGDAVFHMYAGVIVIDGNRLRFKMRDWRSMIVLKTLRSRLKELQGRLLRSPGRGLGAKHKKWMDLLEDVFARRALR